MNWWMDEWMNEWMEWNEWMNKRRKERMNEWHSLFLSLSSAITGLWFHLNSISFLKSWPHTKKKSFTYVYLHAKKKRPTCICYQPINFLFGCTVQVSLCKIDLTNDFTSTSTRFNQFIFWLKLTVFPWFISNYIELSQRKCPWVRCPERGAKWELNLSCFTDWAELEHFPPVL